MNELAKSSNAPQHQVAHVLLNPPAFRENYDDVKDYVLAQFIKSITHLGWKLPSDDDVKILTGELTDSIINDYKTIRREEIAIAFAKGIRGEYGEFFGISVVTFEKFIIGYLASDYRAELGKTMPKAELSAPSKELTRHDRIQWAQKAFKEFKESGFYNDLGNIVYLFLDSEKLIPFTTKEKFEILEEARKQEYARLQNPATPHEARKFNKLIEALIDNNEAILPISRRIALNRYFRMLVENDQELIFANSQSSHIKKQDSQL